MKNCTLARSYFSRNVVALLNIGLHNIRSWTSVVGFKNLAKLDDNNFIIGVKLLTVIMYLCALVSRSPGW